MQTKEQRPRPRRTAKGNPDGRNAVEHPALRARVAAIKAGLMLRMLLKKDDPRAVWKGPLPNVSRRPLEESRLPL